MGTRFKAARNSVVKRLKEALGLSDAQKESVKQPTPPPRTDIPIRPPMPQSPKPRSRTKSSQSTPTPPPIPEGVEPAPLSLSDADYEQNYITTPPPVPERTYPKQQQASPSDNQYQDLPLRPNLDMLKQQIEALSTEQLGDISMNVPENAIGDLITQVIWATRDLKALSQQELSAFIKYFPKVLEKCDIALLTPEALAQKQQIVLEKDREHCIESLQALAAEWQFQELNSTTEQAEVVEKTKQQLMSRSTILFRNDEAVKPLIDELNHSMQNYLQIQPTPSVDQSNLQPFGGLARQEEPQALQSSPTQSNPQPTQGEQPSLQYTQLPPERKRSQYTQLPPERKRQPSANTGASDVVIGGYTDEQKAALQKKGVIPKYTQSPPDKQQSPFFNEGMGSAYLQELGKNPINPPSWVVEGAEKFLKATKDITGNEALNEVRQQLEQALSAHRQASVQPAKPEASDNRSHIRAKIGAHREEPSATVKKKNN